MKLLQLIFIFCLLVTISNAQEKGVFSGGYETNANIFIRDSLIGADNIPQYDRQLFGAEGWFNLNYRYDGFEIGMRYDYFNNSNLLNPNSSYTDQGLGRWYLKKKVNKLGITIGHIYDQLGSGIIYRAFESRPLLIDNALVGARLTYDLGENWHAKVFTGKQRFLFGTNDGVIKGAGLEGFHKFSEESSLTLAPGIGFVNRTLSDASMDQVIEVLQGYQEIDQVTPVYNVYLATLYNTMIYKGFSWYVEGAYKTAEVYNDIFALKTELDGTETLGKFVKKSGNVFYSSLSYARKGLGITVEAKRTENFNFRSDPNLNLNFGLINFIPPMNRQNTYRLTARYSPATQDLSEFGYQADIRYKLNKKLSFLLNYSNITNLDGDALYNEIYTEVVFKQKRDWQLSGGVQLQQYNQETYEGKSEAPTVRTITPYLDFLYKISRKKSVRIESQYMYMYDPDRVDDPTKEYFKQDYGDWFFALAEFGMAPHWIFEVSGMFNVTPGKISPTDSETGEKLKIFYPTVGIYYTNKANRYGLRYVKQVEGVVCSGGICRLEPAFSGFKFNVTSNF